MFPHRAHVCPQGHALFRSPAACTGLSCLRARQACAARMGKTSRKSFHAENRACSSAAPGGEEGGTPRGRRKSRFFRLRSTLPGIRRSFCSGCACRVSLRESLPYPCCGPLRQAGFAVLYPQPGQKSRNGRSSGQRACPARNMQRVRKMNGGKARPPKMCSGG